MAGAATGLPSRAGNPARLCWCPSRDDCDQLLAAGLFLVALALILTALAQAR